MHRLESGQTPDLTRERKLCFWRQIRQRIKKGAAAQTAAPPGNVTVSWKRRPQGSIPLISFTPRLFVCLRHGDVNVALSAPKPWSLYKAEVGQIWLKDIKFCSHLISMKAESERVREELSLPVTYACRRTTNDGQWRRLCLQIFF